MINTTENLERKSKWFKSSYDAITFISGLILSLYILLDYAFSFSPALPKRALVLAFCLAIVFLDPKKKKDNESSIGKIAHIILAVLGVASCLYAAIFWWDMSMRPANPNLADTIFCIIVVLVVLEACRRSIGKALAFVCVAFLLYGFFGNLIPGNWGHKGFTIRRFVDMTYMYADVGLWGSSMRTAVEMVIVFIVYGALLQDLGGGDFFIKFANAVAGKYKGGPAKIAVISSSLFGTISGSPVANVVGTGTFTIPMMKKTGYKAAFAGAVEATASTGGQIMPPVMGAAAFLMADSLGMPYSKIATAAIIPALIFYFGLFVSVHVTALKLDLKGLEPDEVPSLRTSFKEGWHFLLSPALLIYLLVVKQYSVGFSGLFSIIAMIVIYFIQILIQKGGKQGLKDGLKNVIRCLGNGGRSAASITVAFAATGIVISVLGVTGLGVKLSGLLVDIANGNLLLLAVLTAIASIILGMGLPTSACYLIVSVTAAPALIAIGVPPLSAHFFVLYFCVLCVITPPVALASYAAAGLAEASVMETSMEAIKLGLVLFIIPFFILISPAFLLVGDVMTIIRVGLGGIVASGVIAISLQGYFLSELNLVQRVILFAGGFLLLDPGLLTDIIGIILIIVGLGWSYMEKKKSHLNLQS